MEAVSPEAREAKVVSGPKAPSASEREKHEVTHLPHQGWCEHCVRGRSREDAHRSAGVQEREVTTVSLPRFSREGGKENNPEPPRPSPPCAVK